MKFKKLEIYGFKSFADKLEVKFESGVTGIVGPNGCGKSNVADSIRWVMGEQSAKSMRGSSMQDVIFNGTENRKPQSFSEVSLHFDNTEKIFPVDFDEVVLTRKLYRSGDSEYAINKNPCRLKDIVDILRDSGLGKESYCVIGQGKIDSLLSAKPEERRSVFEEAAGISKFKSRKIEAQRKLDRTRENLTRLCDIISELERQLGPLTKQSENAKKFLEFREKLKELELNIYVHQYDSASGNKAIINERLDAINEELRVKTEDFEKAVNEYNISSQKIQELDKNIEMLRDELLELTVGLEKKNGEAKLVQEKLANLNASKEKMQTEIEQDEVLYNNLTLSLEDKKKELEKLNHVLTELERQAAKVNDEYLEVADRILAGEKIKEENEGEIYNALESLGDIKSNLSSIKTEKNALSEKKNEVLTRQGEIKGKIRDVSSEIQTHREIFENAQKTLDEQKFKRQELSDLANDYANKNNSIIHELDDLKVDYHTKLSRVRVLQEIQEENEGFVVSVKRLLEQSKTNPTLHKMIVGVVANLMKVPEKLETAIEMALGASVQNIVTESEEDAKYLVSYLKQYRFGRATFLPIETVKVRDIPDFAKAKLNSKGVLGIASDLIKFDKKLMPIFKHLLGGTIIVDTLDNATTLARSISYSAKIVTLEGDIVSSQGSLTGGSKKDAGVTLIGRAREIEDLTKALEVQKNDVKNLLEKQEKIKENINKNNEELLRLNQAIHESEVLIVKETDEIYRLEDAITDLEREERQVEFTLESILDRLELLEEALNKASNEEQAINDKKDEVNENKRRESSRFDTLRKQRETLYDTLTELKVKQASGIQEQSALENDIDRIETSLADSNYRTRENKLELQRILTDISELELSLENMMQEASFKGDMKELEEVRNKLANLDTYKSQLQFDMAVSDQNKMSLSAEIQRASDKKTKEEMNLQKIDTDLEAMQERVW